MPLPQLVLKMFKGATLEQKQALAKDISEAIKKTLGPDTRANTEFDEFSPENLSEWQAPSESSTPTSG